MAIVRGCRRATFILVCRALSTNVSSDDLVLHTYPIMGLYGLGITFCGVFTKRMRVLSIYRYLGVANER